MNYDENLTMLTDFYEFTMANGFFEYGYRDRIAYFDMFFRKVPDDGGFAIMAGVEDLVQYIKNLKFSEQDIEYFRGKHLFCEEFLEYLRTFRFSCDVWAVPEEMCIRDSVYPKERRCVPRYEVRGEGCSDVVAEQRKLLFLQRSQDGFYQSRSGRGSGRDQRRPL